MGLVGTLGEVAYDIVANDQTAAGLKSARQGFVTTAGDIVNAIQSVSDKLAAFEEDNATLNTNLGITALTLGMNAEELRGMASALSGPTDNIVEMSAAIDLVAKAGLRSREDIMSAVSAFDLLADAVGGDTDKITNELIPAFKAFNVPIQDAGEYTDELAYIFNRTGVSVSDFSAVMSRMGPELAATGVGIDDVSTMLVMLKEKGYDGRNMMQELTAATSANADANKDGKVSLDEMLAAMGMSRAEFDRQSEALRQNSKDYAANAAQIRNENIPLSKQANTEINNTVLGLGGLSGPLINVAGLFSSFAGSISTLAVPAMMLFHTQIAAIGTTLSSTITGFISGFAEGIVAELSTLGLSAGATLLAGIAGGIAVGLAGVWVLLKTGMLDAISNLGRWIETSSIGATIMDALKVVLAPIGAVGKAIIELVKGNLAGIPDAMTEPFDQARAAMDRSISRLKSSVGGLGDAAYGLAADFGGAVGEVVAGATAIFSGIGSAFQGMAGQFAGVFQNIVENIYRIMAGTYEGFTNIGKNLIYSMVNGIMAAGSSILEAIQGIFGQLGSFFGFGGATASVATRATGGPVSAGSPYLVGERGPELFTPTASGNISPASSFGGVTQYNTFNINGTDKSPTDIANEVARVLKQSRNQRGMTV